VRFDAPMLDSSNETYDVVPSTRWPQDWWTVTRRHCPTRAKADRYATDPEYRASLVPIKYANR
jgi:hypothetical protein